LLITNHLAQLPATTLHCGRGCSSSRLTGRSCAGRTATSKTVRSAGTEEFDRSSVRFDYLQGVA